MAEKTQKDDKAEFHVKKHEPFFSLYINGIEKIKKQYCLKGKIYSESTIKSKF